MSQKYDKQLKACVVHETCELGKSPSKVAKEYGIPIKTLEKWITIYHKNPLAYNIQNLSDEERIKELEEEVRRLKRQTEILKKTLIILAKKE